MIDFKNYIVKGSQRKALAYKVAQNDSSVNKGLGKRKETYLG